MTDYRPLWFQSEDGLRLFARHYPAEASPFTLLCMHGLTRNSADFEGLMPHLAGRYDCLVVDQRGRGQSDWDPNPSRYQVPVYAEDMFTLLQRHGAGKAVLLGTSMGGLIAMQMLAMRPDLIQGVILNDVGAVIAGEGLTRIQGYVGKAEPVATWQEAAQQTRAINAIAFPDYRDEDWLRVARRQYREDDEGRPVAAYDPAIARFFAASGGDLDMWDFYDCLPDIPMLILRGELSDLMSRACLEEMARRKPAAQAVEIANRGHAPALDEPQAVAAIGDFLDSLGKMALN